MIDGTAVARQTGSVGTIDIPKPNAGKRIIIKPFHVEDHASVKLVNQTERNVRVWIPNGDSLFVPPNGHQDFNSSIAIPAGGLVLPVKQKPTPGRYHYSVYCEVIGNFGEGNSAPVIICP